MTSGDQPDQPENEPDGDKPGAQPDPLAEMLSALFSPADAASGIPSELSSMLAGIPGMPTDPASMQAMISQVQQLMSGSPSDGPVNWEMARDLARKVAADGGDPTVGEGEARQVSEALRTADLWLDRVTDLPAATARTEAWSRAEWVEATLPTWHKVVEPVAARVGDAITEALATQAPEEMRGMIAGALPMMRSMGGTFFGMQLGHAIGALAREVVSGGDTGLPLLASGRAALLPANLAEFGDGLGLPADEVRLYLALREAAHARLIAGVPWLRGHLLGAVEEYAAGIQIDTGRIESAVREIDPTDPEAMQNALSSGLFEPERTPAQQAALDRLETALALVEGWVDEVVAAAASGALPHADALRETVRRRRAAGGPAEHTFASLVGLELRPRRLREAAAVWAALTRERGATARDELWRHPDLVPTEQAFADPDGFARVESGSGSGDGSGDAFDAELAALLDEGAGPDTSGPDPAGPDRAGPDGEPGSAR